MCNVDETEFLYALAYTAMNTYTTYCLSHTQSCINTQQFSHRCDQCGFYFGSPQLWSCVVSINLSVSKTSSLAHQNTLMMSYYMNRGIGRGVRGWRGLEWTPLWQASKHYSVFSYAHYYNRTPFKISAHAPDEHCKNLWVIIVCNCLWCQSPTQSRRVHTHPCNNFKARLCLYEGSKKHKLIPPTHIHPFFPQDIAKVVVTLSQLKYHAYNRTKHGNLTIEYREVFNTPVNMLPHGHLLPLEVPSPIEMVVHAPWLRLSTAYVSIR